MPSLAEVSAKSVKLPPIEMFGETWNLAYHPGVLTPDFEQRMGQVQATMAKLTADAEDATVRAEASPGTAKLKAEAAKLEARATAAVEAFWSLIAELISEWDITETPGGPPLPIDGTTFVRLPSPLLSAFLRAIRDGSEGKATPAGSPNGSGTETSSEAPALTGTS
jgi:hypothetical protein